MLHGNISNRVSPSLLLRINGTVIKKKSKPTIKGFFKKQEKYELDYTTFDFLMRSFLYTDYKIDLVMDSDEVSKYKDVFQEILNTHQVPYGCVRYLNSNEINGLISSGVYMCFIDNSIDYLNRVGHIHCYTVKEANNFIKRG